jgi:hypothetical protein
MRTTERLIRRSGIYISRHATTREHFKTLNPSLGLLPPHHPTIHPHIHHQWTPSDTSRYAPSQDGLEMRDRLTLSYQPRAPVEIVRAPIPQIRDDQVLVKGTSCVVDSMKARIETKEFSDVLWYLWNRLPSRRGKYTEKPLFRCDKITDQTRRDFRASSSESFLYVSVDSRWKAYSHSVLAHPRTRNSWRCRRCGEGREGIREGRPMCRG